MGKKKKNKKSSLPSGTALLPKFKPTRSFLFVDLIKKERTFLIILFSCFLAAGVFYNNYRIAMWLGFTFAAYSAVANDSIQTIGTFIGSNGNRKWWILWLFIGLIFVGTVTWSWIVYDGDVSHQRLMEKGFDKAPESFEFLQVAAPLFLLILTRLRMPVSTTFLLLSSFSAASGAIGKVLIKSLNGYVIAFVGAIVIWVGLHYVFKKLFKKGKAHFGWTVFQWITSGTLWSVWIMQDAANIAVYLPRQLDIYQFIAFTSVIFLGLGLVFYLRGDKIQKIVEDKAQIKDVRAATLVDLVYAAILFYFKVISETPMSTTWVFIGLLGGRELAISFMRKKKKVKNRRKAVRIIFRDLFYAFIGLVVSMIIAVAVNDQLREEILSYFGLQIG